MQNFKKLCEDAAAEIRRVGTNAATVRNTINQPGADLTGSVDLLTNMTKECDAMADMLLAAGKSIPDPPDPRDAPVHPHKSHGKAHAPEHPPVSSVPEPSPSTPASVGPVAQPSNPPKPFVP